MKKATLIVALILSSAAFSQKNLKISEIHISSGSGSMGTQAVSYTHLRAHETG
jgi:hypothetical protein